MAKTTTTERPTTLEEMEAYFAQKKKEMDERMAELNNKEKALAAKEQETVKPAEDLNDLKRRVRVQLPLTSQNKEPYVVRVNDYTCTIKRGVPVEVPYFVYLSIKETEDADAKTLTMLSDLTSKYNRQVSEYQI